MAGIGFSLRKMLKEDQTYGAQVRSWFHTSIVVAGPWIISIITINMLIYFSRTWNIPYAERELLIATVVYATLFSQVLTAPFQMLMTRYIADRIYSEELAFIKPSFWGVSLILLIIGSFTAFMFFRGSSLPIEFIYIAISLFVVMTTMWILVTYLSTMKKYRLITFSNFIGAVVTFILILLFSSNPVPFREMSGGTNLLLAYFGGMFIILLFLLVVFLSELSQDNGKIFHFIRYFHAEPSLWPVGLFYTLSLWIDNILMWFSPAGIVLFGVYRYAPSYDRACPKRS